MRVGSRWHNTSKIAGVSTELTHEAVIEMSGAAKLAEPAVKLVFEKVGNDTEDDMITVLDRLAWARSVRRTKDEVLRG